MNDAWETPSSGAAVPAASPDSPGSLRPELVGCGFVLGFGWLWFAPVRDLWFPALLPGTVFSGGGGDLFFAALGLLFLCAAGAGEKLRGKGRPTLLAHAPALALALCGALCHILDPGRALIGLPLGLAAGLGGLYWTAALLRLAPRAAVRALATAAFAAAAASACAQALAAVPQAAEFSPVLPAACLLAALVLSLLQPGAPPPPRLSDQENPQREHALQTRPPLLLPTLITVAAFFALGALCAAGDARQFAGSWQSCLLQGLGAVAVLFLVPRLWPPKADRARSERAFALSACAGLALPLLAGLFFPDFFPQALFFSSGALQGLALAAASGLLQGAAGSTLLRVAGGALFLLLLAVNAGYLAGTRLALLPVPWAALWPGSADAAIFALAALCCVPLLHPLFFPGKTVATSASHAATPGNALAADNASASDADLHGRFRQWGLTPRERNVAFLVRSGLSNQEIAASAGMAENTVRIHLKSLYRKTGASGRQELTRCLRNGKIERE